jgi:hypothetical protein
MRLNLAAEAQQRRLSFELLQNIVQCLERVIRYIMGKRKERKEGIHVHEVHKTLFVSNNLEIVH